MCFERTGLKKRVFKEWVLKEGVVEKMGLINRFQTNGF